MIWLLIWLGKCSMQSAFDLGPLPTVAQVERVWDAACFSYEAGEYPPGMDSYTSSFVAGDGGLLNALGYLRRALELLEVERMRSRLADDRVLSLVEDWHGKAAGS